MKRVAITVAAFVLWSGAMVGVGWAWRGDRAEGREADHRAAGAEAVAAQVNQTRATEHAQAETLATIGAKHEEDRTAAATVPAAVVADLRAGRLQLRDDLATCSTSLLSQAVAGAVERDAHAELRAEVAGAAVQIGRDADDHVRASQAVIRADREQ
ncbi:lysis protein [Stenotrophomonas maltophilia]|nr:lysis protein [Stenotrophomonas maltophilia]